MNTQKEIDTQLIIDWFRRILRCENIDEIRERQQETIYMYMVTNDDDELAEFGQISWEDWLSFEKVWMRYTPPRVKDDIDWLKVGRFLVMELKLELVEMDVTIALRGGD